MGLERNSVEVAFPDAGTMVTVMNNEKASEWDISDASRPRHLADATRSGAVPGIFRISPDGHFAVSADRPELDTISVWQIT